MGEARFSLDSEESGWERGGLPESEERTGEGGEGGEACLSAISSAIGVGEEDLFGGYSNNLNIDAKG